MWAHLTRFYAGGPDLAAAWGFIGAAQPLAQVLPPANHTCLRDRACMSHKLVIRGACAPVPDIVQRGMRC